MFNNISFPLISTFLTLSPLNVLKRSSDALFHNAKIHFFFHTAKKNSFLGLFNAPLQRARHAIAPRFDGCVTIVL